MTWLYATLGALLVVEALHDSLRHESALPDWKIRQAKRGKYLGLLISMFILYKGFGLEPVVYYIVGRVILFDWLYWLFVHDRVITFAEWLHQKEIFKQFKDWLK